MERKAKRNCALSVRCRYVARQIHRSPGRGLLALLVAAVLLFGLCYLQESILSNQQEMERLYCTIEVGGRILPKDTASDAYNYGFLSHDVPEQLQETGFITDMVLESAINGVVYGKDKNGTLTGKEAATQIRGVSDLDRYAPVVDGTIMVHFLPNWGTENFSQMNNVSTDNASIYWVACPVLLSTTLCEMLEVQPGDLVNLDFLTAGGLCYICGSFTNNSTETANVLISQEMLDSIHELHEEEPTYLYTRCDFTLDPAQNFRINEFREVAEKLLAEDQKNRENQGIPGDETLFVLQDSELTQAIQPLEKNLSLMRLLFPITQAVAALVSAALAMLLLAQRAKDTAILRVLGISRSQTRWMLGVEPVLAALLGAGLGVGVAFRILGRQALGTSCLISLGLYLAGCFLGTILGTVRAVNRKPLELLQVKE